MTTTKVNHIEELDETTNSDELPEGWAHTCLGELVETMRNGLYKPASAYSSDGVACLRMYNIEDGRILWKNIKRMILSTNEIDEYRLLAGDLLVNRVNSRELVGKTAVVPEGLGQCVYESKNIRVRLIRELTNPDFVNHQLFLAGQTYFNHNSQQVVGMASISQPQIAEFPLRLPPLREQERIVSKTQELSINIDRSRDHLAKTRKILKAFRQSVLASACSGRLTEDWRGSHMHGDGDALLQGILRERRTHSAEGRYRDPKPMKDELNFVVPETWATASFDQVTSLVTKGSSPVWQGFEYCSDGLLFVRSQNVRWGHLDLTDRVYLEGRFNEEHPTSVIRAGDLLLNLVGASVGRAAIAAREIDGANCNQAIAIIRLVPRGIVNTWVLSYLLSPMAQRHIATNKVDVARANFNLDDIKTMPLPVPPVHEQHEIIRRVEALWTLAETIEKRVAAAAKRADRMTRAILAKALRGELVPTEAELARSEGRPYEPAFALLTRIKSEREKISLSTNAAGGRPAGRKKRTPTPHSIHP